MLIARRDGELVLVEQVEHGRLAGELAAHWGNALFSSPAPREAVVTAATLHDEGFREEDAKPLYNARERRPLGNAGELPHDEHVVLYRRGVEHVLAGDAYAGLLVSMHWAGLYGNRWGMQAQAVRAELSSRERELQDQAIASEQRRWIDLLPALVGDRRRSDFEAQLWHNYDLLQAWDVLSLFLCSWDLRVAGGTRPARTVIETLGTLAQEAGDRLVLDVPLAIAGARTDLLLRVVEPGVVALHPYPLDAPRIELRVAARAIPDRTYASQEDAAAALRDARRLTLDFALTPLRPR